LGYGSLRPPLHASGWQQCRRYAIRRSHARPHVANADIARRRRGTGAGSLNGSQVAPSAGVLKTYDGISNDDNHNYWRSSLYNSLQLGLAVDAVAASLQRLIAHHIHCLSFRFLGCFVRRWSTLSSTFHDKHLST